MMRSLYAGVSGLRNHQIRMDVIGNNIANVNTIGFKSNRVTFADMFYQTLSAGASATATTGGTNPKQVGIGVTLGSIDTIFTQGNIESTGRTTDLAVEGDGFFVVRGAGGEDYVTRAGAFTQDEEGFLTNPAGYRLMGWTSDANGVLGTDLKVIQIRKGEEIAPGATSKMAWSGNLDSRLDAADPDNNTRVTSKQIYDSQGNIHELEVTFTKTANNTWNWAVTKYPTGATLGSGTGTISFFDGGTIDPATSVVNISLTNIPGGVADMNNIELDFAHLTQYAKENSANIESQNGFPVGSLSDLDIDSNGVITGLYSNGQRRTLAQVAVGSFSNIEGLTKVGQTMYMESNNSGELVIDKALSGGRGVIRSGSLEMSNVDLSQQFTDMIITQRGFQANSRIITTSDEMLQELVNLKR